MSSNSTVLVTGGAGFIGSNLVDRLLDDDHRVVAVDDLSTGRLKNLAAARDRGGAFDFHRLDLTGGGFGRVVEKARPEVIVHLAARVDVRRSVIDPVTDAMTNVIGTIEVLEAARAHGVRKVVYATSGPGVDDAHAEDLPLEEGYPAPSRSPNAAAKRSGEEYLRTYASLHGIAWTSLALANVYGPRQQASDGFGVVTNFIDRMLVGRPCKIHGDGEQTRDFVYVDDVVHAFSLALHRGDGMTCHIGTSERTSIATLYRALAAGTGYVHAPVHDDEREGDVRHSCLDARLAGRELGWKPWTTLQEGLAATLRWAAEQQ